MDIELINTRLKELIDKLPLEVEESILSLSEESGKTKTVLQKQFNELQKEKRLKDQQESKGNFPIENLDNKLNQMFSKKRLVEELIELQPVYYDKSKSWWLWSWPQTKWERVDETDILNAVERQATINTINSKERNEMLEALKQVSRKCAPIKISPLWIQFKNTLVNIETGEQMRAMPQYFVTNPIPFELDENGFYETPTIDRIFEEWVGKDKVQLLYEIIAYCLIPDYPIHRIFCFMGSGMNGKSKFLELLRNFIGNDNCCSTELDTLINSRFEVTRLHKKLVCQMGETNFGELQKTSMLKKLSGGDLIGFEYKNKDPFEEKNYAKILIATNNLPSTSDKTIGFYRRWTIIDFPNQFTEAKDILSEIPLDEYNALANKCVFLLREVLRERKFTNEGNIEERMKDYESRSNFLKAFLKEMTIESNDCYITKAEFARKFKDWCRDNRHREMSDTSIGIGMKQEGYEDSRKYMDWMNDGRGGTARVWMDIKWK